MNYQSNPQVVRILDNIEKVIIGKRDVAELALVGILAQGHILLEDVPGVGKTMLVKSIARSISATYKRIQFTPDLLPSDVIGVSVFNPKTGDFHFKPGPIVGNIILADEINRTSPKTQSALLEAMEEHSITVDGVTNELPKPFFVMATQNPIDYEGTYELPEAQIDRFLLKIRMGYPALADELIILDKARHSTPVEALEPVLSTDDIIQIQNMVRTITVDESISRYIVELVNKTRHDNRIHLGVSPRGSIALMKASQALAFTRGRDFVLPDDVQYLAPFVLSHRLILKPDVNLQKVSTETIIHDIIQVTPVPIRKEKKSFFSH
ncbi:MAG: MoxR family ATPase [Bacillales bacterium]|jgi:MoxR-like ATPase|nr:MoxR family ATPase [Bacillales bacterium]